MRLQHITLCLRRSIALPYSPPRGLPSGVPNTPRPRALPGCGPAAGTIPRPGIFILESEAMTDTPPGFISLLRRPGPRTPPSPEWEEARHAREAKYWSERLDEFSARLPGIRQHRGDDRAWHLAPAVVREIKACKGPDAAVIARDRLTDVWRCARGVRP